MSRLTERVMELPLHDDVDDSVAEVLRLAGDDPIVAIRSLILGQRSLMESYASVVSAGYLRRKPAR